jgi:biopolymer transport protein ExbD
MRHEKSKFESNGTEGMLDVILGCTLIFILLTALIQVDGGKSQEVTLPAMDITKAKVDSNGADAVKKTIISLTSNNGTPSVFIEDQEVPLESIKEELTKLGNVSHVALRREKDLPCGLEDQVIIACRDAGISRVAIMIKAENK